MTKSTTDDDTKYTSWNAVILVLAKATCLIAFSLGFLAIRRTRLSFREARRRRMTSCHRRTYDESENENENEYDEDGTFVVGFFHPRCSSGGGGERVLWKSIQALGELREGVVGNKLRKISSPSRPISSDDSAASVVASDGKKHNIEKLSVVVYTIDEPSEDYQIRIVDDVTRRFNIVLPRSLPVRFVHLHEYRGYLGEYYLLY